MSVDGSAVLDGLPRGLVLDLRPSSGIDLHAHDRHQLAMATRGVLVMSTCKNAWVLPRTRALWLPAGILHSVTGFGPTTFVSVYVDPERCPITWTEPTAVAASGLPGELVAHLAQPDLPATARQRAEAVLWDVMVAIPITTLAPPLPVDERARLVADRLLADVTDTRSLAEWGRVAGASARTLARLFVGQTGMGFERWRSTARLAAALPLLAAGRSVSTAAYEVGYASPSAFVAAFRREIGTTPADYFRDG